MRHEVYVGLALLLAAPAAAAAQYETPVNPPPPAAQLAEMVALYDTICLRAFPDDAAVARAAEAQGGRAMSEAEVRRFLHEDPGRGWEVDGRTALFRVTLEAPPFHACAVRTLTVAGFPDMSPYRALADRFEAGGGYQAIAPVTREIGDIHVSGGGEQRQGSADGLLVFLTTPGEKHRTPAQSAVEVRFTHQIYRPN